MNQKPVSHRNSGSGFGTLAVLASAGATAAFILAQTRLLRRLNVTPDIDTRLHFAPDATPLPPEVNDSLTQPETALDVITVATPVSSDVAPAAPVNGHATAARRVRPPERPAGERLHYGLPVSRRANGRRNGHETPTGAPALTPHPNGNGNGAHSNGVAAIAAVAATLPVTEQAPPDFDADYLAIVECIMAGAYEDEDTEAEAEETPESLRLDALIAEVSAGAVIVPEVTVTAAPAEPPVAASVTTVDAPASEAAVAEPAILPAAPVVVKERRADPSDDIWWIPEPRVRYVIWMLAIWILIFATGGSSLAVAAELAQDAVRIETWNDLLLRGWLLCGLLVLIPLPSVLRGIRAVLTAILRFGPRALVRKLRGKPAIAPSGARPAQHSGRGQVLRWGARGVALAAFLIGGVLYTPKGLSLALDTDYPLATVTSSSMAPDLKKDEVVLLEGVASIEDLRVGDIIAYDHETGIALRRVVEIGESVIVVKADANRDADPPVAFADVLGRTLTFGERQVKLPFLGNLPLLTHRASEPTATSRP